MATFRTNRPNMAGHIFKDWLISLAIVTLPVIYSWLFPGKLFTIKDSYFYIVGAVMLAALMEKINKDRLYEIHFNNDKQQIVFLYKNLYSSPKQKVLSFYGASLEINESRSKWWRRWESITLTFLKGKREIFIINKYKDGFSVDTLRKICRTVENISLPVSEI
jgi:hypothetical protein